jgi:hypothetical protein
MHVAWGSGEQTHLLRIGKRHADLTAWLRHFKACLGERLEGPSTFRNNGSRQRRPRLRRRTPRRRAA